MPDGRKERQFIALRKEGAFLRLNRTKTRLTGLRDVKVIGKGAFGEVRVVQKVDTSRICAMKSLKKDQVRPSYPLFVLYVMQYVDFTPYSPFAHY